MAGAIRGPRSVGRASRLRAMAAGAKSRPAAFDPAAFESFTLLRARAHARRRRVALATRSASSCGSPSGSSCPVAAPLRRRARSRGSTGCSRCCTGSPASATSRPRCRPRSRSRRRRPARPPRALLEALYSEGLGELAYTNRPAGAAAAALRHGVRRAREQRRRPAPPRAAPCPGPRRGRQGLRRRDRGRCAARAPRPRCSRSATPPPIARTAQAAGLPRLLASPTARSAAVRGCNAAGRDQRPRADHRDRHLRGAC